MKKAKPVALIAAGKLTDSPLTRFTSLAGQLGPVKSSSLRVASRIANSLRAGHPVKDYAEFEGCRLIVVSVPDEMLAETVAELAAAQISWHGKAAVVCSAWLDSCVLRELSARGAAIGSLAEIPGFEYGLYLVEGDRLAVVELRRLVGHSGSRTVAIERSLKPLYLAALTCTGSLLFALLVAASESLRQAGVPSTTAAEILEKQLSRTLRSYLKCGRKAWQPPRELATQLRALASVDGGFTQYLEEAARITERLLEKRYPVGVDKIKPRRSSSN